LGQVLKDIHIPDDVLAQLEKSLLHDQGRAESHAKAESEKLSNRLARDRLEQAYIDKLDGKITEEFWESKSTEWNREQESILSALRTLDPKLPMATMDAVRNLRTRK